MFEKLRYEPVIHTFDIDVMRHVSNIVYIQWMEIGRCLLLQRCGMPIGNIMSAGFGPVLTDTEISYKTPLVMGDAVEADVWIAELGKASAWLGFEFRKADGPLAAKGRQRGLFVDLESGRPRRLDAEQRERFMPYCTPSEK